MAGMTQAKRFVVWVAVSSEKQAEKVSPEMQSQLARQHITKWGGSVVDELHVAESRDIVLLNDAAATIPAYAKLHDYIRRGAFDVLICYDIGRLGRAYTLSTAIIELCRRANIVIYELDNPPHDLESHGSYDEMLIRSLKAVGYQHETMKTRERMRFGREGRAKRGDMANSPPFGYTWQYDDDGTRHVVIDEAAAAVVRSIAAEYLNGRGQIGIAQWLTDRGVPTPSGGSTWLKNSVNVILKRAWTYAGYAEYYRKRRTGYIRSQGTWEPIWDEATAERIEQEQQARAANRRLADTPSRLSGIVWCVVCNHPMWQVRNEDGDRRDLQRDKRKRGGEAIYHIKRRARFYCQPNHPGGSVGTHLVMQALTLAMDDLAHADLSGIPDDSDDDAARLAAQLAEHDAAIAKHLVALKRADDAYMAGVRDLDWLRAQTASIKDAIAAEESTRTKLRAAADAARQRGTRAERLAEIAAHGPAMLTTDDTAAANAWLRRYVRVFVRDNSVVDVKFKFW